MNLVVGRSRGSQNCINESGEGAIYPETQLETLTGISLVVFHRVPF